MVKKVETKKKKVEQEVKQEVVEEEVDEQEVAGMSPTVELPDKKTEETEETFAVGEKQKDKGGLKQVSRTVGETVQKAGKGFIRHRDVAGERRKVRGTFDSFFVRTKSKLDVLLASDTLAGWEKVTDTSLNNAKKMLQSLTTDTALTKKDNELAIVIAALLVDFHKQSDAEQKRLLGTIW